MALFAFAHDDQEVRPFLGAHPAFPAIVAMWFAALLGFGTAVLPAVLVERLVLASGIAELVPAANPPLDVTVQALIALAAAAIGALAGFAAARWIARSHTDAALLGHPGEGAVRPLSAREELCDLFDWADEESPCEGDTTPQIEHEPARRIEVSGTSDLAELVGRLGLAIERHRTRPAATDSAAAAVRGLAPKPAPIAFVSDDTEAALRSALARLQQLREVA